MPDEVKFRSVLLLLLIVLLGLGLALFCLRYTFRGGVGPRFSANGRAHTDGVVPNRSGAGPQQLRLYDGPSGVYHEDSALRRPPSTPWEISWGTSPTSALEAFNPAHRL